MAGLMLFADGLDLPAITSAYYVSFEGPVSGRALQTADLYNICELQSIDDSVVNKSVGLKYSFVLCVSVGYVQERYQVHRLPVLE